MRPTGTDLTFQVDGRRNRACSWIFEAKLTWSPGQATGLWHRYPAPLLVIQPVHHVQRCLVRHQLSYYSGGRLGPVTTTGKLGEETSGLHLRR